MMPDDAPLKPGSMLSALQADRRWIGWRWEYSRNKDGEKVPTKVPYMPGGGGRRAATDNPETWSTYDRAMAMQGTDGIGYVLTGRRDLQAFDLDHCRDKETGTLEPWAQELVENADSYVEVTPSLTGLRILGIGNDLPTEDFKLQRGPNGQKVEAYLGGPRRYITVSFDIYGTEERPLAEITEVGRRLLNERHGSQSSTPPPGDDSADLSGLDSDIALLIQSGAPAGADRSRELFRAIAHMRTCGWSRARIIATLRAYPQSIAARCFESGRDDVVRQVDLCLHRIDDDLAQRSAKDKSKPELPPILSKTEFLRGFVPPNYLVDGMLQRSFVYSMTGQTGHGKTAVGLSLMQAVTSFDANATFAARRVEKGRGLYFVGENPDDIRMRIIGSDALRTDEPTKDRAEFIPGVFDIAQMYAKTADKAAKLGGLDIVIVDTSAAYFLGDDEISNTQMGKHARLMRTLTKLPGKPLVVVLCHPVKYTADPEQLLPRGGGAFLAEMDGNLTCWKHDDGLVELHHNKIRGPGFEPVTFRLERFTTPALLDTRGRELPTVRAVAISEAEAQEQAERTRSDEDQTLTALLATPGMSIAAIADKCGWQTSEGKPHKSKVHRLLTKLSKEKSPLVGKARGQWSLTDKGKKVARRAALDDENRVER